MDIDLPSVSNDVPKKYFQTPPNSCKICLRKATGHHYDVATCNGCKSFFRRVTVERLKYTCPYSKECFNNVKPGEPLPKCKGCRYQRCVDVGMNYLGIGSELKDQLQKTSSCELPVLEKPRQTIESQIGELIDQMIRLDLQSEKFRDCEYNPNNFPSLLDCVKQGSSILPIADKHEPMPGWPLQKETIDEHVQMLRNEKRYHPLMKRWMVYELLTQIELAKALPFFWDLSETDRFCLVQDTVLMSSNLTKAFYSFEQKSDKLLRPDGVRYYGLPSQTNDEYTNRLRDDIGMRCLRAILRVGIDRVEFVLLRVLVLTSPTAPGISEIARKYLTKERQKYNIALFRYIMAKHGASGPSRFANILGFIDVLEHQQRDQRDVSLLVNLARPKRNYSPIIDEIMRH